MPLIFWQVFTSDSSENVDFYNFLTVLLLLDGGMDFWKALPHCSRNYNPFRIILCYVCISFYQFILLKWQESS